MRPPIRPPQPKPQPRPTPNPQPKPGLPNPTPNPSEKQIKEIDWNESFPSVELTEELKKEKPNFYKEFENLTQYESDKPLVVFVYWSSLEDGTTDKDDKEKVEKSEKMEEMLKDDSIREMADKFVWVRVDGRKLSKEQYIKMAKRHGIYKMPCIVLIDLRGKKWATITGPRKPKCFLKTLKKFEKFNERLRKILKK